MQSKTGQYLLTTLICFSPMFCVLITFGFRLVNHIYFLVSCLHNMLSVPHSGRPQLSVSLDLFQYAFSN